MAEVQAQLFTNMADTFAAITRDPAALQATIEKSPPTMDVAIQSLPGPATVPRRLRRPLAPPAPGGARAPALAAGDQRGLPGRHADPAAHRRAQRAARGRVRGARGPVREPQHAARAARPPHDAHGHAAGARVHRALPDRLQLLRLLPPRARRAPVSDLPARRHGAEPEPQVPEHRAAEQVRHHRDGRPWTSRPGQNPRGAQRSRQRRCTACRRRSTPRRSTLRATPTASSARRAIPGPAGHTAPATARARCPTARPAGGNSPITSSNFPVLSGGTFTSRELGIDNLKDVP